MVSGIPSISTNVGDAKNIIGDSGWIIKVGDFAALANCIEKIYNNKNLLRNKSKLATQRGKLYFSADLMISKYEKLYNI